MVCIIRKISKAYGYMSAKALIDYAFISNSAKHNMELSTHVVKCAVSSTIKRDVKFIPRI
jgi:hypothetical protein